MTYNDGLEEVDFSLRQLLKQWGWWAVPILLFASSFWWIIPFRCEPPYPSPLFILRFCQIVGIICSFLLGVWFMILFRRDTVFGRASVGMLGIGMAIAILCCLINRPIPWQYAAGVQLIWLIVVAICNRNDQAFAANRELNAQFDGARLEVFGTTYTLIGWIALKGMAFSACVVMICLGWTWIQIPFFEQNPVMSRFLWIGVGCGISVAGLYGLFFVWMSRIHIEVRCLTNPPKTRKQIILAVLKSNAELVLFLLLIMFWIILHPTILIIGVVLLWFGYGLVLYYWFYRACILVDSRPRLEKLRTLYSDHFDVLKNVLGVPVRDRVQPIDEGLKVIGVRGEAVYPWESIVHLYFRGQQSIRIVNQLGGSEIGPLILSGLKSKARVEAIIQLWGQKTEHKLETIEFVYPRIYQLQDEQRHHLAPFGILVSSIGMIGVGIGFILNESVESLFETVMNYVFVLSGAGCLMYAFYAFRNKPKILHSIHIDSDTIFVEYLDGSREEYPCKDMKGCSYCPGTNGYQLSFSNGNVIHSIDKVSYFGVLKRRLDAMMAQQEQLKSVEERT
jgi:hypothetical protein